MDPYHAPRTNEKNRVVPQYAPYRNIARLLYHSACLKADTGDVAGALKDLAVIEIISNHVRTNSGLIAAMVSFNIDNKRLQGVEYPNIQAADAAVVPMKNYAGLYWFTEIAGKHRALSTEEIAFVLDSGGQVRAISGPFLTMGEAQQSLERYWDMILSDDD